MGGMEVDPAVLDKAEKAGRQLATTMKTNADNLGATTSRAVGGLAGFRSKGVLERVLWEWQDSQTRHRGYVNRLSGALGSCAREYRQTDRANADNFADLDLADKSPADRDFYYSMHKLGIW